MEIILGRIQSLVKAEPSQSQAFIWSGQITTGRNYHHHHPTFITPQDLYAGHFRSLCHTYRPKLNKIITSPSFPNLLKAI